MNNIERGKRLTRLRSMTGLSCKVFAHKYEIGYSTLRQWEHGRLSGLSKKGAEKIIKAARLEGIACSLQWLLHGTEEPPQILSTTEGQPDSHTYRQSLSPNTSTVHDEIIINQEIERFRQQYAHVNTMIIADDSMSPLFVMGDYVGGITIMGDALSQSLDQFCIIEMANQERVCRKLLADKNSRDQFILATYDGADRVIINKDQIVSVAPIARFWRKKNS